MERNRQAVPLRHLREVRVWAEERVRGSGDASWSQYQHMKLIEAIDAILSRQAEELASADGWRVEDVDTPHADWPIQVLS